MKQLIPVPSQFVDSVLQVVPTRHAPRYALDVRAGGTNGVWGASLLRRWPKCEVTGLHDGPSSNGTDREAYVTWVPNSDLSRLSPPIKFDLIVGSPEIDDLRAVLKQSQKAVRHGGYVVYILPVEAQPWVVPLNLHEAGLPLKLVLVNTHRFRWQTATHPNVYAGFIWQEGYVGPSRLGWVDASTGEMRR